MNEYLGMFSGSSTEWFPIALGAFFTFVASILLIVLKRRWHLEDERTKQEQTELKTELNGLGLKIETECEIRRAKDEELGYDIQDTRGALDWLCGSLGKDRPPYRR